MVFMTTNHIERLSSALIRPGRVDVRLAFTHATEAQTTDFFTGFYQVCSPRTAHLPQVLVMAFCRLSAATAQ
jgi:ATP-dependent 26S proteasome regulatory subunit